MLEAPRTERSYRLMLPALAGWLLLSGPAALAQTTLYQETFDASLGTAVATNDGVPSNAWEFRDDCPANLLAGHSDPGAARWGNPGDCGNYGTDFDPTIDPIDELRTPAFDISSCTSPNQVMLKFNYFLDFEEAAPWDESRVEVIVDGNPAQTVADNGGSVGGLANGAAWSAFSLDLSSQTAGGSTLAVSLVGVTLDGLFNTGGGFFVDDLEVICSAGSVDLAVTKTDDVDPVAPGGALEYEISVVNQGSVGSGYSVENSRDDGVPTYDFMDISASPSSTALPLGDEEMSSPIPLGFDFVYYGLSVSEVFVSSNGFLTVLPDQPTGCCEGLPIPDAEDPDGVIAGWWSDFDPGVGGAIHYETQGSTPARVFILQFKDVPYFFDPTLWSSFQFKLFEGSNTIEVHYDDAPLGGVHIHTVGVENRTGSLGVEYFYGFEVPPGQEFNDFAVRFTPSVVGNTATNVVVADLLPEGLSLTGVASTQGSCFGDPVLGLVACQLGDLAPGAAATVEVDVDVDPDLVTAVVNVANASADEEDINSADNLAMELTAVLGDVDLAVSWAESGDPVLAGIDPLSYVATLTNQSAEREATRVTASLDLTLPQGVSLLAASMTGGTGAVDAEGDTITWTIERLAAGSSEMTMLELKVGVGAEDGAEITVQADVLDADQTLILTGDDSATETTTVASPVDLAIQATGAPDPVVAGSTLAYSLTVSNPPLFNTVDYGTENSRDDGAPTFDFQDISDTGSAVFLDDDDMSGALPLGFTFSYFGAPVSEVFASSNGFLSVLPAQTSGCCLGQPIPSEDDPNGVIAGWWNDLNPGAGGTIHRQTMGTAPARVFVLQFEDVPHFSGPDVTFQFKLFEVDGTIEIHYKTAPSNGTLHTVGIEDATGTQGVAFYHDSTVPPGQAFQGFAVRFTPGEPRIVGRGATGVTVTDALPPEVVFSSATPSQGSCTEAGGTVTCDLGDLALQASATIDVEVAVPPDLLGGVITNTAEVTSGVAELDLSNNSVTTPTTVINASVDLVLDLVGSPSEVAAGDELTFHSTVTNLGPAGAGGGLILTTLSPELSFVSSPDGCTADGGPVSCPLGPITAGADVTLRFVAAVDALAVPGAVSTVSTVLGSASDPNLDNNTATAVTSIVDAATIIFRDGFESGDTSAWSQTLGESVSGAGVPPESVEAGARAGSFPPCSSSSLSAATDLMPGFDLSLWSGSGGRLQHTLPVLGNTNCPLQVGQVRCTTNLPNQSSCTKDIGDNVGVRCDKCCTGCKKAGKCVRIPLGKRCSPDHPNQCTKKNNRSRCPSSGKVCS